MLLPSPAAAFHDASTAQASRGTAPAPAFVAEVLSLQRWGERFVSFTTTREASFCFRAGQFTMLGLHLNGRPLMRAFSIASSPYEDTLEFLAVPRPGGALGSRLQHLRVGDRLLVGRSPRGTLLQQNLLPGRTLYLLAAGAGLAPFMSLIRDPELYADFERVVLLHGCRRACELAHADRIAHELPFDPWFGNEIHRQLRYYPLVTREPFRHRGRIPALLASGRLSRALGLPPIDARHDRFMLCGGRPMVADTCAVLAPLGFDEGTSERPGRLAIERELVGG